MAPPDAMIDIVQVQFSWPDRIMLVLVVALASAFFAHCSNRIQRKQDAKTETIKNVSKEFLYQLDVIDSLVKDYWSVARTDMEKGKEVILSLSLSVAFPRLQGILDLLFKLKKEKDALWKDSFQRDIDKIYEYATTDIDVEPREVSQPTIMKTSRAILKLRLQFQKFIYQ